jgi:hypothetical protein
MNVHEWHGHTIAVRTRSLPQFLWMLVRAEVVVDGSRLYTERNVASLRGIVPFEIAEPGKVILGRMESFGVEGGAKMKYHLLVEDEVIAEGSARAGNWYAPYLVLAAILVTWTLI